MEEQLAIQTLLRENLLLAQSRNPKYSLRSFSRKIDIHFGALSSIMNGKRNVSKELAEKITRKLLIDPQKRNEILSLFPEKRKYRTLAEKEAAPEPKFLEIEASEFRLIAEWEHYAVLSLVRTKNFKNNPEFVAERLGITVNRASEVIDRLLTLGFLKKSPKGSLIRIEANLRSSDDTVSMSVRKSHEENLELAKESLHRDSIHQRDFTSLTMPTDPAKMSKVKEMIRKFQDDLSDMLEGGEQTEVYRLAIQFFPLTRLSKQEITKDNLQ
jgi:uncharacterized protein (TIGR02147 family)